MRRLVFLLAVLVGSFSFGVQAQSEPVGPVSASRWDILTADKDLGPFGSCKVYCEVGFHMVVGASMFEGTDNLLKLFGVNDRDANLIGTGVALGYGIGREVPQFFETLWDDRENPGERRVDAIAEALEHTTWVAGVVSAKLFEFGDSPLANALERAVGIGASLAIQYQLLPSRGLVLQ